MDKSVRGVLAPPEDLQAGRGSSPSRPRRSSYPPDKPVATRKAYGNALKRLYPEFPQIVAVDGEVSNSTYAEILKDAHPDRFFEMYIAEQNMVGAALGLQARGKIPFVSTFAAFFSRAYDQIRMSQYSDPNLKFCGSHAGVSIGEDGPSQMGLEDLAMFRAILDSVVLYPCDAVSTERLVEAMARHTGHLVSAHHPHGHPHPLRAGGKVRHRRLQGAAPEPAGCGHGRRGRGHPVRGPQGP